MHPTFSIIFFTVVSGAGFGLATVYALLHITGLLDAWSRGQQLVVLAVVAGLVTAGLVSSSMHLANPKNAWRAVMRVRTSWLSREAVAAIAFCPILAAYALAIHLQAPNGWLLSLALVTALLAQVTVFTTAMIYASLKTMPNWRQALVPLNYHLLSLASGAAILALLVALLTEEPLSLYALVPVLLVAALLGKGCYYARMAKGDQSNSTIQTATGLSRAAVRLLDLGHTADTFTTREFGYRATPQSRRQARLAVVGGLALGTLLLATPSLQANELLVAFALALVMLSVFIERWLFFVEAKQVVMLYHGVKTHRPGAKGPLSRPAVLPIPIRNNASDAARRAAS